MYVTDSCHTLNRMQGRRMHAVTEQLSQADPIESSRTCLPQANERKLNEADSDSALWIGFEDNRSRKPTNRTFIVSFGCSNRKRSSASIVTCACAHLHTFELDHTITITITIRGNVPQWQHAGSASKSPAGRLHRLAFSWQYRCRCWFLKTPWPGWVTLEPSRSLVRNAQTPLRPANYVL